MTLLVTVLIAQSGVIHPQLAEILNQLKPQETIRVIVHMKAQADLTTLPKEMPKSEKIQYLKDFAQSHQADLMSYLKGLGSRVKILQNWWIFNGLMFESTRDIIEAVARREDVDYIIDDFKVYVNPEVEKGEFLNDSRGAEWNIERIRATDCWNDGMDGTGIIVGNIDTGVDKDHSCFGGRWISGGWYDAVNGQSQPYDDNGHGTHTMGIICGGDGNGPYQHDIGVAPGANFIAAKGLDSNGSGYTSWLHNCFSWFATQTVDVCSNSWGSSATTSTEFWNDCQNLRNLGIYPVFSIGNEGPNPNTAGTPGNFPIVTGVGAVDNNDTTADFSSRGPAPNQSPWNNPSNWSRPDWNRTKPDISAPGVAIRSAAPGNDWAGMSGTSQACPHVAGAVAILLQRNHSLPYDTIYNILLDNADQPSAGAPYPNNNYGWGILNVYNALNEVPINAPNVVLRQTTVVNDNNGNGALDPGEDAGLVCLVRNTGDQTATNVQATLRTSSPYITISDSTYTYGTLNANDSTDNSADPFDVTVDPGTPNGTKVNFDLYIVSAESSWTRPFSLNVGLTAGTIIWGPHATGVPQSDQYMIYGIAYDQVGDRLYVCEYQHNQIYVLSSDSNLTSYGTITAPDTKGTGISYSPYDDNLWFTSANQKQIWKIDKSGSVLLQFPNPANDYPIGLALNYDDTLWSVDRRSSMGATQYIYIGDTLGSFSQYVNPVQGNYNSRNLCYDTLGKTYVMTHTWFNDAGNQVDSVGIVEYAGEPPTLTGNRLLLPVSWNIRGIEFDPRDGNYWIGIPQRDYNYNQEIVKIVGFHSIYGVKERKSRIVKNTYMLSVFPNPAVSSITLNFETPNNSQVNLKVFDALGRLVKVLSDGQSFDSGAQTLRWNLRDKNGNELADGIYFVLLETPQKRLSKKVVITH